MGDEFDWDAFRWGAYDDRGDTAEEAAKVRGVRLWGARVDDWRAAGRK